MGVTNWLTPSSVYEYTGNIGWSGTSNLKGINGVSDNIELAQFDYTNSLEYYGFPSPSEAIPTNAVITKLESKFAASVDSLYTVLPVNWYAFRTNAPYGSADFSSYYTAGFLLDSMTEYPVEAPATDFTPDSVNNNNGDLRINLQFYSQNSGVILYLDGLEVRFHYDIVAVGGTLPMMGV